MKRAKKAARPPKMAVDFCDSVHVLVPKPYFWLSSKPAISIVSAAKKALGDLQFGQDQESGTSSKGVLLGIPGAPSSHLYL